MPRAGTLGAGLVSVAAVGIAVWAGPGSYLEMPMTVLAIVSASVLFVEAWSVRAHPPPEPGGPTPVAPARVLRAALGQGAHGRETLLATLDRLERSGPNPGLPPRPLEEWSRLLGMTDPEFRQYLIARLDRLESMT